jgi:hypothetical protein
MRGDPDKERSKKKGKRKSRAVTIFNVTVGTCSFLVIACSSFFENFKERIQNQL